MKTEIKEIDFYGDKIAAAKDEGGKIQVSLRRIVENLGLSWGSQYQKVMSNPLLNSVVSIIETTGSDGKKYDTLCIPADMLPGYLLTININKVAQDAQPKLIRYAREAYRVLGEVFMGPGFATHSDPRRVDAAAMAQRANEIGIRRHQLLLETTQKILEIDPEYSRTALSRWVEVSTKTNLLGERVTERRLLDVQAFLEEMGMPRSEAAAVRMGFGKRMKARYVQERGKHPEQHLRFVDGAERKVYVYTEDDRPLMEEVYRGGLS